MLSKSRIPPYRNSCRASPLPTLQTPPVCHLFDDPQRAAVEKVGAVIGAAAQPVTEPGPIKRRGW
jgi:hypothetical protein